MCSTWVNLANHICNAKRSYFPSVPIIHRLEFDPNCTMQDRYRERMEISLHLFRRINQFQNAKYLEWKVQVSWADMSGV